MTSTTVPTSKVFPDAPTAALNFEEFSYWGPDGTLRRSNMTRPQENALVDYLVEKYNVASLFWTEPFLVLGIDGEIPKENERPFTIAGYVVIWRPADDDAFFPIVGVTTYSDGVRMDPKMLEIFHATPANAIPPRGVFLYWADHIFKDCIGISIMWTSLVVELPKTSHEDFMSRLAKLPGRILGTGLWRRYHNGPLPCTESQRRTAEPDPRYFDRLVDNETDYVEQGGMFHPGAMIKSVDEQDKMISAVTASILVEKGEERRLICPYHNWESLVKKNPTKFGQEDDEAQRIFKVVQGEDRVAVGHVHARMENTDIALAKLDEGIKFENTFMNTEFSAKTLVCGDDLRVGDTYVIDGFTTGQQYLYGYGARKKIGRRPRAANRPFRIPDGADPNDPHLDVAYIEAEQGIHISTTQIMNQRRSIRASVCGAVLLRCQEAGNPVDDMDSVMARGEVCGMLNFIDLQSHYMNDRYAETYMVFADIFDPLIEDGWKIVQVEEGKTATKAEDKSNATEELMVEEVTREGIDDGPFTKKQRRR